MTSRTPDLFLYILMGVMLISGTAHTLLMKLQVRLKVPPGRNEKPVGFAHPVTQTLFMCFGEMILLCVYYLKHRSPEEKERASNFPKLIMAIPTTFDLIASTLVHTSYIFIPASVVQMCRSANMIFVCIMSIFLLKKRQYAFHLIGIGLVFLGIILVALSANVSIDEHDHKKGANHTFLGVILCLVAQLFHATQNVLEEKFLDDYKIPTQQAVGLEGFFGSLIVIVVLLILNPVHVEDTIDAIYQMNHSGRLTVSVICGILATAFFNWSGMTITEQSSCVARTTIDGARTFCVWIIELAVGWHFFQWVQLVGFILVVSGTLLYNRIIEVHRIFYYPDSGEECSLTKDLEKKHSEIIEKVDTPMEREEPQGFQGPHIPPRKNVPSCCNTC